MLNEWEHKLLAHVVNDGEISIFSNDGQIINGQNDLFIKWKDKYFIILITVE